MILSSLGSGWAILCCSCVAAKYVKALQAFMLVLRGAMAAKYIQAFQAFIEMQ